MRARSSGSVAAMLVISPDDYSSAQSEVIAPCSISAVEVADHRCWVSSHGLQRGQIQRGAEWSWRR